jgi:putative endonuclease
LYIGITNDLAKRVKAHNTANASRYTRGRRPVKLKYFEKCRDKSSALKKEIKFKKYSRKKKLKLIDRFDKALINNIPSAKHR